MCTSKKERCPFNFKIYLSPLILKVDELEIKTLPKMVQSYRIERYIKFFSFPLIGKVEKYGTKKKIKISFINSVATNDSN